MREDKLFLSDAITVFGVLLKKENENYSPSI